MKHVLVGLQFDVTEGIKTHTENQFKSLEKFIGNENVEFTVTFSKEGNMFKAHSHAHFGGVYYVASALNSDMYKSIDEVAERLETQMRKEKEKRTDIRPARHEGKHVIHEDSEQDISE